MGQLAQHTHQVSKHLTAAVDAMVRFKDYINAAAELTCFQPKWKKSVEEAWGWEAESMEDTKEVEVGEEEGEEDVQ